MRAAVLHTIFDMRVEEVDTLRLESADILLQVFYCGVCGSDVPRIIKNAAHYYPIILGHEFSGMIVDVGNGLSPDLIGRKSVCAPLLTDFSDPECARGNYSLGKNYNFIGSNKQGGFAEYVGTPHSALTLRPAEFELIIRKELTLKGSRLNYSAPNRFQAGNGDMASRC